MLTSDGATFPHLGGRADLGNAGFTRLGAGAVLGVPAPIWIMAVLAALAIFVTRRTAFGRHVYAIGGNERAALLAGVRVSRVKFFVYCDLWRLRRPGRHDHRCATGRRPSCHRGRRSS